MAIFNSYVSHCQRVTHNNHDSLPQVIDGAMAPEICGKYHRTAPYRNTFLFFLLISFCPFAAKSSRCGNFPAQKIHGEFDTVPVR